MFNKSARGSWIKFWKVNVSTLAKINAFVLITLLIFTRGVLPIVSIILSKYLKLYSKKNSVKDNVYLIANKPGVKIYPGEISKAIKFLKEGKSINYEGATGVEFDEIGDTFGSLN